MKNEIKPIPVRVFTQKILQYYATKGRTLPWRFKRVTAQTPYLVFISELMLHQTQVDRVIPKFNAFIQKFPTFAALAAAHQRDVLMLWHGLGYNRRAIFVHQTAQIIVHRYQGKLPKEKRDLLTLPGIGPYTAGALRAFVWNIPEVFIETNIRATYIHEFFPKQKKVHDKELLPLIEQTLNHTNVRLWYWALMDYGSMLKRTIKNPSMRSSLYTKQSTFRGSDREIRGKIIAYLLSHPVSVSPSILFKTIGGERSRFDRILSGLTKDGFLIIKKGIILAT